MKTLAHSGLVCENPSTQNINEPTVFFNANAEFLKVFLVREIDSYNKQLLKMFVFQCDFTP